MLLVQRLVFTTCCCFSGFPGFCVVHSLVFLGHLASGRRESASGNGDFVESIRQGSLRAPTTLDNISGGMSVIVVFSGGRDACC